MRNTDISGRETSRLLCNRLGAHPLQALALMLAHGFWAGPLGPANRVKDTWGEVLLQKDTCSCTTMDHNVRGPRVDMPLAHDALAHDAPHGHASLIGNGE